MLLYLDTRDLINILEKGEPISREGLLNLLRPEGHRLVVSFAHVAELAAPLRYPNAMTNVSRLLGHLEELPLAFLADLRLEFLEFREALEAWQAGRECRPIDPFVPRIDHTLPLDGLPPTYQQLNSSIAETVFRLWSEAPGIFDGHRQHIEMLVNLVNQDRQLPVLPDLREHFSGVLQKRITQFGLSIPSDLKFFSYWIYDEPARCPSARIGLEIYRLIVQERMYTPKASLFEDYSHVKSVPYVDALTLDRQMSDYVRRACKATGLPYHAKVQVDVREVIRSLEVGK
jgi:hypothetical protein